MEKDAEGLEYVSLSHESGASSKVFLFGGDLTSYIDADGTEWYNDTGPAHTCCHTTAQELADCIPRREHSDLILQPYLPRVAVRPDAKMDGSKPISGGLSHW